jgi:hypothetical protein
MRALLALRLAHQTLVDASVIRTQTALLSARSYMDSGECVYVCVHFCPAVSNILNTQLACLANMRSYLVCLVQYVFVDVLDAAWHRLCTVIDFGHEFVAYSATSTRGAPPPTAVDTPANDDKEDEMTRASRSVDCMIAAHKQYIQTIATDIFLDENDSVRRMWAARMFIVCVQELRDAIDTTLKYCMEMCAMHTAACAAITGEVHRRAHTTHRVGGVRQCGCDDFGKRVRAPPQACRAQMRARSVPPTRKYAVRSNSKRNLSLHTRTRRMRVRECFCRPLLVCCSH